MTYTSTEQANIETIREQLVREARQDWDAVYDLVADDCITTMGALVLRGKAEMRAYDAKYFIPVFAKSPRTILNIVADGDAVAFRWTWRGTLRVPTGRFEEGARVRMDGTTFHVVREGLLVESFDTWGAVERDEN